jgi:hypothetical protein
MRPRDIAWAAGFLEGEGSFSCPRVAPQIQASQVQRDPLDRLQAMFGGHIYHLRHTSDHPLRKPYYRWNLNGTRAAAVMMTITGLMSPRRVEQIIAALAPWKAAGSGKGSHQRTRTHCPKGHPYSGDNLIQRAADRQCRACATATRRAAGPRKEH